MLFYQNDVAELVTLNVRAMVSPISARALMPLIENVGLPVVGSIEREGRSAIGELCVHRDLLTGDHVHVVDTQQFGEAADAGVRIDDVLRPWCE